jgi:hypothetical protein
LQPTSLKHANDPRSAPATGQAPDPRPFAQLPERTTSRDHGRPHSNPEPPSGATLPPDVPRIRHTAPAEQVSSDRRAHSPDYLGRLPNCGEPSLRLGLRRASRRLGPVAAGELRRGPASLRMQDTYIQAGYLLTRWRPWPWPWSDDADLG